MNNLKVAGLVCLLCQLGLSLENGLARTPPMGWMTWGRFRCNTDCVNDPNDDCISENLLKQMADVMASEGYLDAGYDTVVVDDCWMSHERDADGKLQPDPDRFPSGMKALGDYIHALELKYGIYENYGKYTCEGYPGILGHLETDANTLAEWGADYTKIDGCYADPKDYDTGYPLFGQYLNATGRPIVYSCSWPVYQTFANITPDWPSIIDTCNLWRNYGDIGDSWGSVLAIMDYFGDNQDDIIPNAGPGHWNDPDMLIIGNFGLSYDQSKVQMGIWSILAAPLLMSTDLRIIKSDYKDILLNSEVIAVNQDFHGIQGRRVYKEHGIEVWIRPIDPVNAVYYSKAVAVVNARTDGIPQKFVLTLGKLNLTSPTGYNVTEMFTGYLYGIIVNPSQPISISVNPSGIVLLKFRVQFF